MDIGNYTQMSVDLDVSPLASSSVQPNDPLIEGHVPNTPIEELEKELPLVLNDQLSLGELVSRVAQSVYAELSELAET